MQTYLFNIYTFLNPFQKQNKVLNVSIFQKLSARTQSKMDYNKIDTGVLNQMLLHQIRELENDGLVDVNFKQCHSLKEDSGPLFFLDLITVFLKDVHTVVKEMTKALDQPVVDYNAMYCYCIKLKGSSSCIGARRIKDACDSLRKNGIDTKLKEGCLQALDNIKSEYSTLYHRLNIVMKIEETIVSRGT